MKGKRKKKHEKSSACNKGIILYDVPGHYVK